MEELIVVLDVIYYVDLGEEDESVQNAKCSVVEHTREHDVSEILDPEELMDLGSDRNILDLDDLTEFGDIFEELPVRGLEIGEVGVI